MVRTVRLRGGENEFEALRDYQRDDDYRAIIGARPGRASAGYFVVMLGVLGLALKRRRKRGSPYVGLVKYLR